MNTNKETAFQKINEKFGDYANLILHQLSLLEKIIGLGSQNIPPEILEEIKKNEEESDRYEIKLSERIINTIVLQQPVASDLRKLMACYQIVMNLERIGDQVTNIVNVIPKIQDVETYGKLTDVIYNMLIVSVNMVQKSILSFVNNDKDFAIWTIKNDAIVDEMHHKLINKAIGKSKLPEETQKTLLSFIHISSIISNIERIGDHATNVAEASIYSMEGTDIRHQHIKEDSNER